MSSCVEIAGAAVDVDTWGMLHPMQLVGMESRDYPVPCAHPNCRGEVSPLPAQSAGRSTQSGLGRAPTSSEIPGPLVVPRRGFDLGARYESLMDAFIVAQHKASRLHLHQPAHSKKVFELDPAYGEVACPCLAWWELLKTPTSHEVTTLSPPAPNTHAARLVCARGIASQAGSSYFTAVLDPAGRVRLYYSTREGSPCRPKDKIGTMTGSKEGGRIAMAWSHDGGHSFQRPNVTQRGCFSPGSNISFGGTACGECPLSRRIARPATHPVPTCHIRTTRTIMSLHAFIQCSPQGATSICGWSTTAASYDPRLHSGAWRMAARHR